MVAVTLPSRRKDTPWGNLFRRVVSWRLAGSVAIADQAVVSGVNFLTAQMLIAWGSKEAGGAYALVWILVLFTRSTVVNLVATPYTVKRGQGEAGFKTYAASSFLQQLLISAIAAVVLAIVGVFFLWRIPGAPAAQSLGLTFLVAAGVMPLLMTREYVRQVSFAHAAPWAAFTMDLIAGAAQIALLYAMASTMVGAPIAYLASGLAALLGVGVWWLFRPERLQFAAAQVKRDWLENWSFGRWAMVSQVTGNLAPLPWILFAIWGAGATGSFDGANRIVGLSNILVLGYCNFLASAAARAFAAEGAVALRKVVRQGVLLFTIALGSLCVLSLLFGSRVLELVLRGQVHNAGGIVAVLALATMLDGLSQIALHGLRAMNRPSEAMVADVTEVLVTLLVGLPLIWFFSFPGAAWAMVLGRSVGLLLRWRAYRHRVSRNLAESMAAKNAPDSPQLISSSP